MLKPSSKSIYSIYIMVVADQFLMGSTNVEMENEKDSAKEEAVVKEIGGHRKKKRERMRG